MYSNVMKLGLSVFLAVAVFGCKPAKLQEESTQLLVADFNSGQNVSNIGAKFGAWDKDPADATQTCQISFSDEEKVGSIGKSLVIRYDVESPNAAYNGIWMQLNNSDVTKYTKLVFYIKGDAKEGFTSTLKIELKSASSVGKKMVSVNDAWQKVEIPFSELDGLSETDRILTEFTMVFDDVNSKPKEGLIYLDSVYFE